MPKWSYTDLHFLGEDAKAGNKVMSKALEKQKLQLRIKALAKKEKAGTLTEQEYNELYWRREELKQW